MSASASSSDKGEKDMSGATKSDSTSKSSSTESTSRVVCIGDLHGNLKDCKRLWENLTTKIGKEALLQASVVFLGDYVDRGEDTKGVLDWLIALRSERKKKGGGGTHFVTGNHDFSMAAYLGCLPCGPLPADFDLDATLEKLDEYETIFEGKVKGGMHYQGRRWGGHQFEAYKTYKSYGVDFVGPEAKEEAIKARNAFIAKVPLEHKKFLQSLKWMHEEDVDFEPGRIVCIHAGLRPDVSFEKQAIALRARDLTARGVLTKMDDIGRFEVFSGRKNVESMHPDLEGKALLISGHHGFYKVIGDGRIITDMSAGLPSSVRPIEAVVLPDKLIIGSHGGTRKLEKTEGRCYSISEATRAQRTCGDLYEKAYHGEWTAILAALRKRDDFASRLARWQDPEGYTLLHQAVYHKQVGVVNEILRRAPDVRNLKNMKGETPHDSAKRWGSREDILALLKPKK